MVPYRYKGLIYGHAQDLDRSQYITLVDFPVPVVLKNHSVYIVRKPLHIPTQEYGLPAFDTQDDLSDWFEANKDGILMKILLEIGAAYAKTDEAIAEASYGVNSIFGLR